ncbi:MAG: RNA polymerase sigma factor [Verrucomicrobia bacterium]|nr:RNA polymerase sigma factor [Verrucomicrobiota bacterium]
MKIQNCTAELESWFGEHHAALYRYALNLSRNHHDACDLAQQTFYLAQIRRGQLRDARRVKSWLSVTLRRIFLQRVRHEMRFPKCDVAQVEHELPGAATDPGATLDADAVRQALTGLDENFRRPLTLFYLEDRSYQEIAVALAVPVGTVMSRLSRGKTMLRKKLECGWHHHARVRVALRKPRFAKNQRASTDLAFST